ncbi:hypothetical protein JXM67_13425 [candidate division WOR-3 bacterium]|nr:hypothetical protein [candidate division WOR-3 bacterium]
MFEVVVRRKGHIEYIDESCLGVEERYLALGRFMYLWSGELEIDYRVEEGLLIINDKLAGIDFIERKDLASIDCGQVVTVSCKASEPFQDLSDFPGLNAVRITGDLDRVYPFVENLQRIKNLKLLWLDGSGLDDAGLRYIAKCKSLKVLGLVNAGITDKVLANLSRCRQLRVLDLSRVKTVKGFGLKGLRKLELLKRLVLSSSGINDYSLRYLAPLYRVQELFLDNIEITDQGALILGAYKNLRYLDLRGTIIDSEQLTSLVERLPECTIITDDTREA